MTKTQQVGKNIKLTEKLATFIQNHPKKVKDLPQDASFVAFSLNDNKLNKKNNDLLDLLIQKGTAVVKAEETNNSKSPWRFTSITP